VNDSARVAARKHGSRELNARPTDCKSSDVTTTPSHVHSDVDLSSGVRVSQVNHQTVSGASKN